MRISPIVRLVGVDRRSRTFITEVSENLSSGVAAQHKLHERIQVLSRCVCFRSQIPCAGGKISHHWFSSWLFRLLQRVSQNQHFPWQSKHRSCRRCIWNTISDYANHFSQFKTASMWPSPPGATVAEPVGAGSARSPLPALKNLLHPEALRRLPDERGDGFRLRNVDRVATFDLDDAGACTLRHGALSGGRDHPIISCDQVPARLGLPSGLGYRAVERVDTPRDLRICHEFR